MTSEPDAVAAAAKVRAELVAAVQDLADARRLHQGAYEEYQRLLDRFEDDHRDLLDQIAELKEAEKDEDERVRDLTLTAYEVTKDKHPAPGVGIRVQREVDYIESAAFKWAKEHSPVFIVPEKLDAKAFEKFARDNPKRVPVATIVPTPEATITGDLDAALAEAGVLVAADEEE